jgi:branched-chain amino acid transport system substrate-binding protein
VSRWRSGAIRPSVGNPVHLLNNVSRSQVILSAGYTKNATDPTSKDDPGFKEWSTLMDQYYPSGDKTDSITVTSYTVAQTLVPVLKQCGNDLISHAKTK